MKWLDFKSYCDLVENLNYIKFSSYKSLPVKGRNLAISCIIFYLKLLKNILLGNFRYPKVSDLMLVAPTLNNQKAILPVVRHIQHPYQMVYEFREIYPMAWVHIYSALFFFYFLKYYFSKDSTDRKLIRNYYHDYLCAIGYYMVTDHFFKKNAGLKCILFANDHIVQNRCLIELASDYGIKTIYIQHASVTERFPALKFSFSFLDGLESWEKYRNVGNASGTIFLSGSPRFDEIASVERNVAVNLVGVALNIWDSVDKVLDLCKYLQSVCNKTVIVRPHPSMEKKDWSIFASLGIVISYPSQESSFDFLADLELLIANESSIHLDASLMNVPSVVYNFSDYDVRDWYSYIKKGMVKLCTSKEGLKQLLLDGIKVNSEKVKYYVASFSTPYEGRIGEHIAGFVDSLLIGEEMNFINEHYILNPGYYQYKE